MSNKPKGKLDQIQISNISWLVTTIKKILRIPIKYIRPLVFSFKRTLGAAQHKINILSYFNRNIG